MGNGIKKIAVIGSTGSIGRQVLDIAANFPSKFKIVGLAGGENTPLLRSQVNQFRPRLVHSPHKFSLTGSTKFSTMKEMATHPEVGMVVVATSGKIGLLPTLAAISAGKRIALANKEVLVMAGAIAMKEAKLRQAQILPVDSEHSAIYQCLQGEKGDISQLILTASGGPFYHYTPSKLSNVTVNEALEHPTWKMGKKVTIDSATLMNKGLEAIEASWLFSIPLSKIKIIIHPQSIVHSLVELIDGSVKAQLSVPDMRFPIQYALSYPERLSNDNLPRLDFSRLSALTFETIDYATFPCLRLALYAGEKGGTYPAVLCAADEIAVQLFLEQRIAFTQIAEIIDKTMSLHQNIDNPSLEEIMMADEWARDTAHKVSSKVNL